MKLNHEDFMQIALAEAKKAGQMGEVPIGAVLVAESGDILAQAHNQTIRRHDPSAHAEMLVLREAGERIANYRLLNTTLYVSVEPCIMCMGAMVHARVFRLVFGTADPKWGAAGSLYNLAEDHRFNHRVEVESGICREEARALMQRFFKNRRNNQDR